jgi:RNA polymerase sigma-70 factor, ECF subfamily
MSKPGASAIVSETRPSRNIATTIETQLVDTFNGLRDELVGMLLFMLGNRDDAQDAAQDAFIKCWRSRASIPDIQNLRAWIFRVGLNTARDMQRSAWNRKSRPLVGEELMLSGRDPAPYDVLEDRENLERLRRAILDLREEEKEVFLLRQNGGLTYEQIAEARSSPVGTVKTQMRSAIHKLRLILGESLAVAVEA